VLYFGVVQVNITAGSASYQALIGSGLLSNIGALIAERVPTTRCVLISDTVAADLYAEAVQKSLAGKSIESTLITIRPGEGSKTLQQVESICDQMLINGLDRRSSVIGLGGGVVGDISGFAAAIFHRGIPHVQIPTTLLAMVDSSIGGKTGVNTARGKNLIGAVHQPMVVIDDIDVLRSLPEREFKQGFAEIIKHAVIADRELFEELSKAKLADWRPGNSAPEKLARLVKRNIEIKSAVVKRDELDRTGHRAILNFGHTVGHGIEQAGDYNRFLHGEAISLGMVAAAQVSVKRAGLPDEQRAAIVELLQRFDLPTQLPSDVSRERVVESLKFDKKFQSGEIRFVVTPQIGSAYLSSDITLEDIHDGVGAL
jgi:3-dehydroquinate synthase